MQLWRDKNSGQLLWVRYESDEDFPNDPTEGDYFTQEPCCDEHNETLHPADIFVMYYERVA